MNATMIDPLVIVREGETLTRTQQAFLDAILETGDHLLAHGTPEVVMALGLGPTNNEIRLIVSRVWPFLDEHSCYLMAAIGTHAAQSWLQIKRRGIDPLFPVGKGPQWTYEGRHALGDVVIHCAEAVQTIRMALRLP